MADILQNANSTIDFEIESNEEDKKIEDKKKKKSIFTIDSDIKIPKNLKEALDQLNILVEKLNSIKAREKATFFRLLSVMINAGIPIVESLITLSNQTLNPYLKRIIKNMAEEIKNGKKFSDAMIQYKNVFSEAEIGMIEAGEFSGKLNSILQDIATDTENSASLKAKIKGALTYPIIIMVILGTALVLLMTMVVPKLLTLFASTNQELPMSTQIIVSLSGFFRENTLIAVIMIITVFIAFKLLQKTPLGKYYIDKLILSFPIIGDLIKKAALSRFSRMLSNLIKSGISIVEALEITANAIGNEVYKKMIIISSHDTAQGIPLGQNLKGHESIFPDMIVSMIAIGEKTGEIATILDKVANFYEDEVDNMTKNFSKLIEPIILVVLGLSVGLVIAAIMQPIISLTDIADKV